MDEVYNVVPYKTFDETVGYKIELSMGIRKFSNSSMKTIVQIFKY